jgi:hypothetical protein
MLKPVKKRFDLNIEGPGKIFTRSFELDKTIKSVKGVLVTSDKDDHLYYRGNQKIEINKEELFPENYESKLLMSGINVPPKQRYYDLGKINPGNGSVKITYSDNEDGRTPFMPYRVSIYLDCETEDGS